MEYQAKSGPWRNFYLSGAQELRNKVVKAGRPSTASPDTVRAMSLVLFFDCLSVRLTREIAGDTKITSTSFSLKMAPLQHHRRTGRPSGCDDHAGAGKREDAVALLQGFDHIVHAGDIGSPTIIERLERVAPVSAVRGNVDVEPWASMFPDILQVTLFGQKIFGRQLAR